jgi:D-glycero-D-manno-heptose 1,7-bisphosphate phosphatase
MSHKAVFVDRDGTLIEDPGYLGDPALVRLLPGVPDAIRALCSAGYKVVAVTNQSGVARGFFTEQTVRQIHTELQRQLAEQGVSLGGFYYCPYHPEGVVEGYSRESDLRKPSPGMLLLAASELNIDLSQSWMVGDGDRDVEAGRRAGCRTIRIRHDGSGAAPASESDAVVKDLAQAVEVILHGTPHTL